MRGFHFKRITEIKTKVWHDVAFIYTATIPAIILKYFNMQNRILLLQKKAEDSVTITISPAEK